MSRITSDNDERPSKSARKRAAHDAQALGTKLVELPDSELRNLPLDEALRDAIEAARSIKARGGRARQLQLIGKLMRNIDTAPIIEALELPARARALEAERDKRVAAWRDRLLQEGAAALAALRALRADGDFDLLAQQLHLARNPRSNEAQRVAAARALFRELRRLFSG